MARRAAERRTGDGHWGAWTIREALSLPQGGESDERARGKLWGLGSEMTFSVRWELGPSGVNPKPTLDLKNGRRLHAESRLPGAMRPLICAFKAWLDHFVNATLRGNCAFVYVMAQEVGLEALPCLRGSDGRAEAGRSLLHPGSLGQCD